MCTKPTLREPAKKEKNISEYRIWYFGNTKLRSNHHGKTQNVGLLPHTSVVASCWYYFIPLLAVGMASSVWSLGPIEVLIKAWEMEVGAQSVGSPSVGERGKMSSSSFCQTAKEAS